MLPKSEIGDELRVTHVAMVTNEDSKPNLTELLLLGGSSDGEIQQVLGATPLGTIFELIEQDWLSRDEFKWMKRHCERYLSDVIDGDTCLAILKLANLQKWYILLAKCFKYAANNFKNVWMSRDFLDLTPSELSRLIDDPGVKYHIDLHTAVYFWYRKDSASRQTAYNLLLKRKYSSSKNLSQLEGEIERYKPKYGEKRSLNLHPNGAVSCELVSKIQKANGFTQVGGVMVRPDDNRVLPSVSCPSINKLKHIPIEPKVEVMRLATSVMRAPITKIHKTKAYAENIESCPALDELEKNVNNISFEYHTKGQSKTIERSDSTKRTSKSCEDVLDSRSADDSYTEVNGLEDTMRKNVPKEPLYRAGEDSNREKEKSASCENVLESRYSSRQKAPVNGSDNNTFAMLENKLSSIEDGSHRDRELSKSCEDVLVSHGQPHVDTNSKGNERSALRKENRSPPINESRCDQEKSRSCDDFLDGEANGQVQSVIPHRAKSSSTPILDNTQCNGNTLGDDSNYDINQNKRSSGPKFLDTPDSLAPEHTNRTNSDSAYESCPSLNASDFGDTTHTSSEKLTMKSDSDNIDRSATLPSYPSSLYPSLFHESCPSLQTVNRNLSMNSSILSTTSTDTFVSNDSMESSLNEGLIVCESCPSLATQDGATRLISREEKPRLTSSESCPAFSGVDKPKPKPTKEEPMTLEQIMTEVKIPYGYPPSVTKGERHILILGRSSQTTRALEVFVLDVNSLGKEVLFLSEIPTRGSRCTACFTNFCMTDYMFVSEMKPSQTGNRFFMFDMFQSECKLYMSTKPERSNNSLVAIENRIFSIGGTMGGKMTPCIDVHNLKTKRWKTLTKLAIPVLDAPCVAWDEKLYVFGGRTDMDETVSIIQRYDTQTRKVRILSILPCSCTGGKAVVYRGVAYVATVDRKLIKFDTKTCACSTLADQPFARSDFAMVTDGKRIFIVGGRSGKELLPILTVYDISCDSWSYATTIDVGFTACAAAMITYRPS